MSTASADQAFVDNDEPFFDIYGPRRNDLLGFALLVAAALHAVFILGVSFTREQREHAASKLEITLAQYKSAQAPQRGKLSTPRRAFSKKPANSGFKRSLITQSLPSTRTP